MFADSEWKSVWRIVKQKPLPKQPPVLSNFLKLLTHLGGDNNRATELPPTLSLFPRRLRGKVKNAQLSNSRFGSLGMKIIHQLKH